MLVKSHKSEIRYEIELDNYFGKIFTQNVSIIKAFGKAAARNNKIILCRKYFKNNNNIIISWKLMNFRFGNFLEHDVLAAEKILNKLNREKKLVKILNKTK